MHVAALYLHPVKSARSVRVDAARVTPLGFAHDRRFMVVDATGRFVSQRERPALRDLEATVEAEMLVLHWRDGNAKPVRVSLEPDSHAATRPVTIWEDAVDGASCSDEVAAFLSDRLGPGHALVTLPHPEARPRSTGHVEGAFHVSFADGYPFLIANDASRRDLEERSGTPLAMERFRPNLVIDGLEPWGEDDVARLRVGEVTFDLVKPCVRCVVTTLDPDGGAAGKEPLATLATFRRDAEGGVTFGVNAVARGEGRVGVGDRVEVLERRA